MQNKTRCEMPVYIVDDEQDLRDALQFLLEAEGYQPVCFSDGEDFWSFAREKLLESTLEGCLILDSRMPGMSGQQLQAQLNVTDSVLGIVFLTGHGDVPMAVESFKRGAVDFLQKPVERTALLEAVKKAFEYSLRQGEQLRNIHLYIQLTVREREIMQLLAKGFSNLKTAEVLHISTRTVEVHKANILKHLQVTTVAELARIHTLLEPVLDQVPPPPARIRRG